MKKNKLVKTTIKINMILIFLLLNGCSSVGRILNPFQRGPTKEALLGEPNDHALLEVSEKSDEARKAFEQLGSYQRQHLPSPNKPVIVPSVVRVMWVPDHISNDGDLVAAHYYYLKVLDERWAVTDAYDLAEQLNVEEQRNIRSTIPFVSNK
jgi:hypothetical protein